VEKKTQQKTLLMLSNGMYIMTSRSGSRYGAATVTWVSQASFKSPLMVAAMRKVSTIFECLSESRTAAIHILRINQEELARKFLSTTQTNLNAINGEPFKEGKTSAPVLDNVPAYIECRVHAIADNRSDHAVVIMEAVEAECREQVQPLTIAKSPWEYGG
jgi:flavin reductase (DIM6/NTAB) family NADH-FMN oxidoreductase RutF